VGGSGNTEVDGIVAGAMGCWWFAEPYPINC
jgi:hypothetical protein